MAPKKIIPFFAELGKMLNLVRSISAELNEEIETDPQKTVLYNIWYARDTAIARLQTNLQQLEDEIAYFFTGNGSRKTIQDGLNTQMLRHKFTEAFKTLTTEYLNIKSDYPDKNATQQANTTNANIETYTNKFLQASLMN